MDNMLILSIIVPIYNVEKYLERCIESLFAQDIDVSDYEIIMVNDGSTDKSLSVAEDLAAKHENIIVVSQNNRGLAGARNTGLKQAKGKYIMFVDSDDFLMPNVISKMLRISFDNELDILMARMKVMDADGRYHEGLIQPFKSDMVVSGEYALLHGVNIASVCGMLYSSDFLHKNNLIFTEGMTHEDVDFNTRCYPVAKRMLFSDLVSYVYFWNSTSLNRSNSVDKVMKKLIDDILVASNTLDYVRKTCCSVKVCELYKKRCNSIMCSTLLTMVKEDRLPYQLKADCIKNAKAAGLYPIKGRTLSWKTTLLIPILNSVFFEKYLMMK